MIKIRCSSLDRILNCSHSLLLPIEKNDTIYSKKGTEEHNLSFKFLSNNDIKIKKLLWGKMNPNTKTYCRYINEIIQKNIKVHLETTYLKKFDNFILQGTPDAWFHYDDILEIIDLKNGYQEVSPLSNQLKGYAILVSNDILKLTSIKVTIIQNEIVSSLKFDPDILNEFVRLIDESINDKTFETGEHCTFCPSKIHCTKMTEPITQRNSQALQDRVKNKNSIKKMIDDSEQKLYTDHPEWFIEKKWGKGRRKIFIGENIKC